MADISIANGINHAIKIKNYAGVYSISVFIILFLFMSVGLLFISHEFLVESSRFASDIIAYCGIAFSLFIFISLFFIKEQFISVKDDYIYFKKSNYSGRSYSAMNAKSVKNCYIMFLPIFSRKYKKNLFSYEILSLLNPIYLLLPVSAVVTKIVVCIIYRVKFTSFNNMVLLFEDGEKLSISLFKKTDIEIMLSYIKKYIDMDSVIKVYISATTI